MKIDCLGEKCRRIKITAHLRGGDTAGLSVDGWMGGGVWVKVTMLGLDERKWSLSCKGRHTQTTAAFTRTVTFHNRDKRKLARKRPIRSWPDLKEVFDQIEKGRFEALILRSLLSGWNKYIQDITGELVCGTHNLIVGDCLDGWKAPNRSCTNKCLKKGSTGPLTKSKTAGEVWGKPTNSDRLRDDLMRESKDWRSWRDVVWCYCSYSRGLQRFR